jgi:Helix-turn-helix domain
LFDSGERRTWIPLKKVASALDLSERTLRRFAVEGRVPGGRQRSGRNGTWYFRREVIEEWWAGKIFGYAAASAFSGYSIARLKQMIERGEISARKMSWNRVAFDPVRLGAELDDYIEKHWIPARPP